MSNSITLEKHYFMALDRTAEYHYRQNTLKAAFASWVKFSNVKKGNM